MAAAKLLRVAPPVLVKVMVVVKVWPTLTEAGSTMPSVTMVAGVCTVMVIEALMLELMKLLLLESWPVALPKKYMMPAEVGLTT